MTLPMRYLPKWFSFRIVAPVAHLAHLRRSRLRFYDSIPLLIFLRPYRCEDCYHRLYVWRCTAWKRRHRSGMAKS